jgi:hypothetical protein
MVTVRSLGREHGEEAMAIKAIIDRGPSAAICSASTLETQERYFVLGGKLVMERQGWLVLFIKENRGSRNGERLNMKGN